MPLQRLLTMAAPYLYTGMSGRGVDELASASVAELQRRWQHVLGPPSSPSRHQVSADAIAAKVAECFPACPVAWSGARQHSPGHHDRRGLTRRRGTRQLPARPRRNPPDPQYPVGSALGGAAPPTRPGSSPPSKPTSPRPAASRRHPAERPPERVLPDQPALGHTGPGRPLYWSSTVADSLDLPDEETVLSGAAMTVIRRGQDLIVQVAPSGPELDFFEVIADIVGGVISDAFQPVAPAAYRPRVTIDKLVLAREQWVFQVADSAWAFAKDEADRYYQARRWRQEHGLPERVFYRVPAELKPAAADFRSIVLVNLLAKHIRQTHAAGHPRYTVTEMLPDLDQLWLTDHHGQHYSSELRFVAYDTMR